MFRATLILLVSLSLVLSVHGQQQPRFHAIAIYENGGHHVEYSKAARVWLDKLAADSNFSIDYIQHIEDVDSAFLHKYQLFIQLDYVPYAWTEKAQAAFKHYIEEGQGGWIGFHHASLLGDFDGYKMWPWFHDFIGGVVFKDYIATFASATVHVENKKHPVMKNVPDSFVIQKDEWYTYDQSPRPRVKVLANVDENSYQPATTIKMGDHPVIWSNPTVKARNVYIFMGHDPALFQNTAYTTLFRNAIFWAAKNKKL
ncbi:ThuA domain-containing protein [Chitinophaga costaii]|nr:ThuA domain-containing protein [Chitinophaga costaii]